MKGSADLPTGGELNAVVTSALVGIHTEHLRAWAQERMTFHHGNVLVTLMNEVMTPAERRSPSAPRPRR